MAEPHWTSYVGMFTGIIGAITGIAGAITGFISYRKSNRLKSLDLRLELRKSINEVHANLARLRKLINDADKSKKDLFAARGMFQSGAMDKWENKVKVDRDIIGELSKSAPNAKSTYDTLKAAELESELVAVHNLSGRIKNLLDKYSELIRSDDEQRKQLREDRRVRPPRFT